MTEYSAQHLIDFISLRKTDIVNFTVCTCSVSLSESSGILSH